LFYWNKECLVYWIYQAFGSLLKLSLLRLTPKSALKHPYSTQNCFNPEKIYCMIKTFTKHIPMATGSLGFLMLFPSQTDSLYAGETPAVVFGDASVCHTLKGGL